MNKKLNKYIAKYRYKLLKRTKCKNQKEFIDLILRSESVYGDTDVESALETAYDLWDRYVTSPALRDLYLPELLKQKDPFCK